jgi:hypothetical protein
MNPNLRRLYFARGVPEGPSDTADAISGCCGCSQPDHKYRTIGKSFGCGAQNGWPQANGGPDVQLVEVLLPGYSTAAWDDQKCRVQPGGKLNFTLVKHALLDYENPSICSRKYPKPNNR